ncbi:MAG TPA: PAN/Apple domain-containing protein, partial [Devosia sp.]|nr:PAN/Apple domain-containing protein [Devosia sp.]
MQRLARLAVWLEVAVILAFAVSSPLAGDRSVTVLKDKDLPGFDYSISRGTTLDKCQAACVSDNLCRAFTFNSKTKWCFLKGDVPETPADFKGATSGTITTTPAPADIEAARLGELPFPAQDLVSSAKYFA